jgi:hypothetical protein
MVRVDLKIFQHGKWGEFSTLLTVLCFSIISSCSSGYGKSDVYNSGYDHGCNDAGILDKAGRYINQPEARPFLNSDEFMHGYNDGFGACSGGGGNTDNDDDDDNQNQMLPPRINCDMADPLHYYCPMPPPNRTCNVYGDLPSAPTDLILRYPEC